MIYVDTSVAAAYLLAEDRVPPEGLWEASLVSSRLLAYELWTRVNASGRRDSHGDAVAELLARVALVELAPSVLARALEPFPVRVRTLDALHLATVDFLRSHEQSVSLASYDGRMCDAARALGIPLWPL